MKKFLKKITAWTWAFILLFAVFFTAGMFTLGDVRTTGKSLTLQAEKTAYYSVTLGADEKLSAVYVKLDNFYSAKGDEVIITLNTSTSATASLEENWGTGNILRTTVLQARGGDAMASAKAQNWIALAKNISRPARTIAIRADADIIIQEIVCLNQEGELLKIKGYKPSSGGTIPVDELAPAYDAQDSFTESESAYYNFTAEEAYYLNAVKNLLAGKKYVSGGQYVVDNNFNYLATVLFAPSVALFGGSVFSMRLPVFLAACAILVFAYLFVRSFTKNKKYAFLFALILSVGGMLTAVGRMAAPYAFVASALVASGYFMYRFFAKGISSESVYKDGLNILLSGVFAAFAMAIDMASIFPVVAILVLFGFGLRRQKLAYQVALKKTEGKEESVINEEGTTVTVNKEAALEKAKYEEKQRVSWCYAALSFLMVSVVLVLFAAILCYPAAIRANGNKDVGLLAHIWQGAIGSLRSGAIVPFGKANQSNIWAWWLPVKAATIYTGANSAFTSGHIAWNIVPNLVVSGLSLLAVVGVTIKVAFDFAKGNKDKKALRLRRTYFILLGGLAAAMLGGCLKLYVTPVLSLFFHVLYTAFLPLAATLIPEETSKAKKYLYEIAQWAVVALSVAFFVITVPSTYGILVSQEYGKILRFVSFINNGYLR